MPKSKKIKPKIKKVNKKVRKKYLLLLYVVGQTPNCEEAYRNLKKICDKFIPNIYSIEIVDLLKFPKLAKSHQIIAIPTVVKKMPAPMERIIGNLTNTEKVLAWLDCRSD